MKILPRSLPALKWSSLYLRVALSCFGLVAGKVTHAAYRFEIIAGSRQDDQDGVGLAARFSGPCAIAAAPDGSIYVADAARHIIRKIAPGNVVTTIAGTHGVAGFADGPGSGARFNFPLGLAVDTAGNVIVADAMNSVIRRIAPDGTVSTVAGSAGVFGAADGPAASAYFNVPRGVAVGSDGSIYVADANNQTIRRISPGGEVSTLAGSAGVSDYADGVGSAARFRNPAAIAIDAAGVLYVADRDSSTIRRITPTGVVSTLAGLDTYPGYEDGVGSAASFVAPEDLAVDSQGNVYVFCYCTLRKITPAGVVSTLAGSAAKEGSADGLGAAASFGTTGGIVVGANDRVLVADGGGTVREISSTDLVTTVAGRPTFGFANGPALDALLSKPTRLAVGANGDVFLLERDHSTIRRLTSQGTLSTLVGPTTEGVFDPSLAAGDLTYDAAGSQLFFTSLFGHNIVRVGLDGQHSTYAGGEDAGAVDGPKDLARFFSPSGIASGPDGTLFVADTGNQVVRRITTAGVVSTLAGLAGDAGSQDGVGANARFLFPFRISVLPGGDVEVTDHNGDRQVKPDGTVTTVGSSNYALGVECAPDGRRYRFDNALHTLMRLTASRTPYTVAGNPGESGHRDGVGKQARFSEVSDLAFDARGNMYLAEPQSGTIRKGWWCDPHTDFDSSSSPDILLENAVTGQRVLWLMDGASNTHVQLGLNLGYLDPTWRIVSTADFSLDEMPDVLLENSVTGQRVFWVMGGPDNAYVAQGVDLGSLDPHWHMAGAADFNRDDHPDIILEHELTGQRVLWLMGGVSGASLQQSIDLGFLDPAWHIVGLADFNADGAPDVLLENSASGQRVLWLMGGAHNAQVIQGLDLGVLPPVWHIVKTTDFNADRAPDILLENSTSGQRVLWLMGGPNNAYVTQGLDLGVLDAAWRIKP